MSPEIGVKFFAFKDEPSSNSRSVMTRARLIIGLLAITLSSAQSNVDVYPPLTREMLVGTWEGVAGIGSLPVVFHIRIAPQNEDSYLAEIYPEHLNGSVYRLQTCTIKDAKVYLRFAEVSGRGSEWWIEGEGYGDAKTAWINGRIGTGNSVRESGPPFFYLAKGTWVRSFGDASRRGGQKIAETQAPKK